MQYFAGHGKKQKHADEVMRFRQHVRETVSETAYRVCQSTGGENSTGGLPDEAGRKSERGMRRRVSLLRAVLSGADILIMDEPLTGLDEENRARSAAYLMEQLQGRTLLATTHREEDVDLLRGKKIYC